jgi:outer membrane receptor protein involved in Fe transport
VTSTLYNVTAPVAIVTNSGGNNSLSLLLKHNFSKDHKLSLDLSYNTNRYAAENTYIATCYGAGGEFDSSRSTTRHTLIGRRGSNLITSIDYENPIDERLKLSLGGRNEVDKLDNALTIDNLDPRSGIWTPDTVQTNHYLPKSTINALYANLACTPVEGLSLQGGLRMEAANLSAGFANGEPIVSRSYTNLFPSGSVAYTISEQQSLTLGYRRSIALPDIDALNPTRLSWIYIYISTGNTYLIHEFTQRLDLN